jgi:predicted ATPase with chaperone activity
MNEEYHIATMKQFGERLLDVKAITADQLKKALERQRQYGGRLGANIVALGYLSREELEKFFRRYPRVPQNTDETGLELSFVTDLVLKHILFLGEFTLGDVSSHVKLPFTIVDSAVEELRREKLVEVKSASQYVKASYRFQITGQGKSRASELLSICRYVGPAPVTLGQYNEMVEQQTIKHVVVFEETVKKAFSSLIISESLLRRLGPAVSSGKALFIYGPPGNGKTTIAETIGGILPETVYIPHAIFVGGQIISVFDPVAHVPVQHEKDTESVDQRWVLIKRPVVMAGGELSLKMLDLEFNPISKFYEAPLQMKANNGLFIVDDFGRQQVSAQSLLNRWIVPLERRTDFMTIHTGMKFNIPFDQLVIFATNLDPKDLVDDAFLRRIRYKIKIDHPSPEEYEAIFRKVCDSNGLEFRKEIFDYLMKEFYRKSGAKLNACHPRDLIDHIIDDAHYYNHPPELTKRSIAVAWENYFVEM